MTFTALNETPNYPWGKIRYYYEHKGYSFEKLSEKFGPHKRTIWNVKEKQNWQRKVNESQVESKKPLVIENAKLQNNNNKSTGTKWDQDVAEFKSFLGKETREFASKKKVKSNKEAWLVATDWHVPYHDKKMVFDAVTNFLEQHSDNGNSFCGLVIGGDFLDGYRLNSYGQDDRPEMFRDEMAAGTLLLDWLSSKFDEVVMIDDNHVIGRIKRDMQKLINPALHCLIQMPYDLMIADIPNARHGRTKWANGETIGWFTKIGDAVIAHAETHGAAPLKAVSNLQTWLENWNDELGLGSVRCVIEAHVHKLGDYYVKGGTVKIMESGCLVSAKGVSYAMGADVKYKPAVRGVIHLIQYDGITDFNETKTVKL